MSWWTVADMWNGTDRCAVVIVNRSEQTMRTGWAVLWRWLSVGDAIRICSDSRTAGPQHYLAWVREPDLVRCYQVQDDGRYDHVLADLGVAIIPA